MKIADIEHLVPETPPTAYLMELRRYEQLEGAMEKPEVVALTQALYQALYLQ
ncbi:hypothetical protein J7E88_29395 [Streptomyces sp. ISL-10]|uniref:hypothetical protein n=1 Tax=Streptomyces sp. ISL-10 TaxID=2819172 RepID=UPI001BEB5149|nr:hypothetical protein [Streptomyces sp. ISL-10]MBT2369309.1 hypothetical protein [Streptomyces sp. ISL-10]